MPTETTLNSLKVHKVPDFETWEENYNQTNGIGISDVVVIPPEELKKGVLPDQTNNSGKFLTTDGNGNTSWATVDALPSQSGNSGKYLKTNGSAATWENAPVTSVNSKTGAVTLDNTDVGAAASSHSHGNITNEGDITATAPTIANGDQIIINDNSASKITNGPTFDGSTTTKYLSQKGTWESVPTINYPVTSVNSKTGAVSLSASDVSAVATSAIGANSGVAPLNASGKIDSTYLPSYVDDVIEGYYYNSKFYTTSAHTTEITGETGKIFVDLTTNKTYRYGGSSFTEISQGSIVSVSRDLTSGTKIGTLTINGTGTDLYAPTPETFTVTGGASTIVSDNLTANRALISNTNGKVAVSDVTSTELGYLDGVTSAIQTQINDKQAKVTASGILKGDGSGGVSAATAGTDYQAPLPSQTNNSGKFLTTNGSSVSWANAPEETFVAIYQTTTFSEILQAYNEGKILYAQLNTDTNLKYFLDQIVWSSTEATINEFRFFVIDDEHNDPWAVSSNIKLRGLICSSTGGYNGWSNITRTLQENVEALSSLSGNSGKFLTTNGSALSWGTVDTLPSQTNNSGKFLTTNGTSASWATVSIPTVPTMDSTPTNGNSSNTVSSDGVYDMVMGRTKIYTATCSTGASTAAKVATLDDSTGFSLAAGVKVAVTFTYGNSATTPTLNVNSTGAQTIALPSSATAYTTGNGTTYNTWGAYETVLFTYTGTYWAHDTSGYLGYLAYNTASGRQAKITASGILKGDGSGGVTAATAGTDYQAPLPSQSGNSGKYLTTNGSAVSWASVDALPSQTGNSGKYLTTNGASASWESLESVSTLTVDSAPVASSTNLVTSGGVYSAVESAKDIYWCSVVGTAPSDTPSNIVNALSNNKICAFKLSNNEQYICSSITPSTSLSYCNFFNITYTPSPTGLSTTYGMKVWRLMFDNNDYTTYSWESENVPNALASVFVCTYGSTYSEEIETAWQAGKICILPLTADVMDGSTTACAIGETYILTYRKSATEHKFTSIIPLSSNEKFTFASLWCNNNTWSIGYYNKDPFTAASTSAAGIVQLSDLTNSTSSTKAATSYAAYTAYNRAATLTGRTVAPTSADTSYTTLKCRGEKLLDSTTYDAVTNWSTHLVNGAIVWCYE